jgi:triacylglycerol lipase
VRANDGVVPIRSQVWGKLVWAGHGDHLDVLGHFGGKAEASPVPHVDWLCSGSDFDRARFDSLMDAIAHGLLAAKAAFT